MTTFIRCYACSEFFPKNLRRCPECGTEIRAVNVGLLGARWASVLNERKRHAIEET